jgi:endonuclease YncB( thermonuclease family)
MARYSYRKPHGWLAVAAFLISLFIFAQQQGVFNHTVQKLDSSPPGTYSVSRFIDGDTIQIDMNGTPEKVRFIGVDTPETHKPNTPVQCYGPAAAAFTKNSIGSQKIHLESDSLSSNRDRYQRLLRYVYLQDGTLLNQKLIEQGYGFYYPYFPFTKSAQFKQAEDSAMHAHKGLWGNCSPTPTKDGGYVSNPQ